MKPTKWPYSALYEKYSNVTYNETPSFFYCLFKDNLNEKGLPITPEIIKDNPDIFQPNGLPVNFGIHRINFMNPEKFQLWCKYCNWIKYTYNISFNTDFGTFIGAIDGAACRWGIFSKNDAVILTLEEWDAIINQPSDLTPEKEDEFIPGHVYEFSNNTIGWKIGRYVMTLPDIFTYKHLVEHNICSGELSVLTYKHIRHIKPLQITHEMITEMVKKAYIRQGMFDNYGK